MTPTTRIHLGGPLRLELDGEPRELARADLALAERTEALWVIGRALRIVGEAEGRDGLASLRAAVGALEGGPARLEHGRALAALGDTLVENGDDAGAAASHAAALTLAERCGARALAARLRSGLGAAGST